MKELRVIDYPATVCVEQARTEGNMQSHCIMQLGKVSCSDKQSRVSVRGKSRGGGWKFLIGSVIEVPKACCRGTWVQSWLGTEFSMPCSMAKLKRDGGRGHFCLCSMTRNQSTRYTGCKRPSSHVGIFSSQ